MSPSLKHLFLVLFCFPLAPLYAQSALADKILRQADTARERYIQTELPDLFMKDTSLAFREVNEAGPKLPERLAATLFFKAATEANKHKAYSRALYLYRKACYYYRRLAVPDKVIETVIGISKTFILRDELDSATHCVFSELKKVPGNALYEAALFNRAGVIFKEMKDNRKAMDYLLKADAKFQQTDSLYGQFLICKIDNDKNLGVLYRNRKSYDTALFYLNRSLAEAERIHNDRWIGIDLNSIGILYKEIGNYPKAIECLERSVKLKADADNKTGVATSYGNLGNLYQYIHNYKKAETYYRLAYDLAKEVRDIKTIGESSKNLYELYDETGQTQKAYPFLKEAFLAKDSIYSSSIAAESAKLEAIYENQKKSKEIELSNFKNQELNKNLELKNRTQNILIAGALLLLLFLAGALWSYAGKRKANTALNRKNSEISEQKILVEHQNKEILDSINYAQKIQSAILPTELEFKERFKDAFVLFKPKHIVSGDFYWISEKEDTVFYATADCTGHGVPGGFMSMLASSLLNEIVNENEVHEPAEVLNLLRQRIIQSLKQKGEVGENKDGMDMTFCRIHKPTNTLTMAGANNPVWIIREGQVEIIKADKFPVGISTGSLRPFTQKEVALRPGDMVYTFTDGYPDQFGGEKGKKFMYKQFQELLTKAHGLAAAGQLRLLSDTLAEWKGSLEQVDDICVIGVRI